MATDEIFMSITRREHHQVLGLRMEDITHVDDVAANRWLLDRALQTGVPFVLRKRYVFENAEPQWVENRYSVLNMKDRERALIVLCRKVTSAPTSDATIDFDVASYKGYIKSLASGLADMAQMSGHALATDLLNSAAEVIEAEDV
ncbi:MAG: hypothetical protein ACYDD1_21510 [Caulobacteraceae bacterium]